MSKSIRFSGATDSNKLTLDIGDASKEINNAPQDFIVVDGQSYRVKRSPRAITRPIRSKSEGITDDILPKIEGGRDSLSLHEALENARNTISFQNSEIIRQAKKIEELEAMLEKLKSSSNNVNVSLIERQSSKFSGSSTSTRSAKSLPERLRSGTRNANPASPEERHVLPAEFSLSLASMNSQGTGSGTKASSTPSSTVNTDTPSSVESIEMGAASSGSSKSSGYGSSKPSSNNLSTPFPFNEKDMIVDVDLDSKVGLDTRGVPKGLTARLAMSASERRKIEERDSALGRLRTLKMRNQSPTSVPGPSPSSHFEDSPKFGGNGPNKQKPLIFVHSPDQSIPSSLGVNFQWRSANLGSLLFIVHDNPQLGATVSSYISNGIEVMLEAKEDGSGKDIMTCFVLGKILYSGPMGGVEDANPDNARGAQVIVAGKLCGIKGIVTSFPTRQKGDIIEMDLSDFKPEKNQSMKMASDDDISFFFSTCKARVDVILDPIRSDWWFPYFEGRRKMAPQFRSRGIGYIRLGDDMSRNGAAFLSIDAGSTFLDDGLTFSEGAPTPTDGKPGRGPGLRGGVIRRRTQADQSKSSKALEKFEGSSDSSIDALKELVQQMKPGGIEERDLKWNDRVDLLGRLTKLVESTISLRISPSHHSLMSEVTSVLVEYVTKQNNPHVLKAVAECVAFVGECMPAQPSNSVAWRLLLLETINLLRASSRVVSEECKRTLGHLYSQGVITISSLAPLVGDIIAGPRGKGLPKVKNGGPAGKGASSASPSGSSSSASNSSKVVKWLTSVILLELEVIVAEDEALVDKIDVASLGDLSKHLLWHREEVTRDAAVGFLSALILLDIVYCSSSPGSTRLTEISKMLASRKLSSPTAADKNHLTLTNAAAQKAATPTSNRKSSRPSSASSPSNTPRSQGSDAYNPLGSGLVAAICSLISSGLQRVLSDVGQSAPRAVDRLAEATLALTSEVGRSSSTSTHCRASTAPSEREGIAIPDVAPLLRSSSKNRLEERVNNGSQSTPNQSRDRGSRRDIRGLRSGEKISAASSSLLNEMWFEVSLILRKSPADEKEWAKMSHAFQSAPSFFETLDETATKTGLLRANILAHILPFDESTSSNDQSSISDTPIVAIKGTSIQHLQSLRDRAVSLRSLIRVKMADEADLRQAILATSLLKNFCREVENTSLCESKTAFEVIQSLS
jgi:hypothetical protein